MVKLKFFILICCLLPLCYSAQTVTNIKALQDGQNIIVTYKLQTPEPCTINLFVSTNNGNVWQGPLKQVQGQVGSNIKSGNNSITFFVLNEYNELRGDEIKFKVEAIPVLKPTFSSSDFEEKFIINSEGNVNQSKPSIIVIPYKSEGGKFKQLLEDTEKGFLIRTAISRINNNLNNRGFKIYDFLVELEKASVAGDFLKLADEKNAIVKNSGADIFVVVDLDVRKGTSGNEVQIIIEAFNAVSDKSFIYKLGTSGKFYTDNISKLLEKAIDYEIDEDFYRLLMEYQHAPEIYTEFEEMPAPEIFTVVEEMPEFPGGAMEMMKYIQKNIQYPQRAKEAGLSGKCFLKFVVNQSGYITDVTILKGVPGCGECDKEAIRVLKSMPRWKAGKQNGRAVSVFFNLPLNFQLPSQK